MKIKFCGIRRLEDVAFCNELQPEYLGMILSSGFRRTISPETAEQLVKAKSRSIAAVGVFVNETPEHIAQVLKQVPLDVIQLHGSETAEIVSGVRWRTGLPVWKAVQVQTAADIQGSSAAGSRPADSGGQSWRHGHYRRLGTDRRSKTGTAVSAGWRTDTGECGRSRSQGTAGRRGLFQRHRNRQCKRLCKNEANCNDNTRCITWAR